MASAHSSLPETYPAISLLTFFGVHSRLAHTLCFIFSLLFSGCVPRHFIFEFFQGTRLLVHHLLWLQHTPIHRNVPRYLIFYIFRGTRLLVHHLLWLQHTPIHRKRTPTFYFLHFSGYATQLLNLFSSPTMHKRIPCGTSLHTVSFN